MRATLAGPHLAHGNFVAAVVHGSSCSCFKPSAIFRGVVDAQHAHRDLIAGRDHFVGIVDARPAHFGDVQQTLDAAAEIDERAEVGHRHDAAGNHRAGHDRLARFGGVARCSASSCLRRDTTTSLPPFLYSMMLKA